MGSAMDWLNNVFGWLMIVASVYLVGAVIVSAMRKPGENKPGSGGIDV